MSTENSRCEKTNGCNSPDRCGKSSVAPGTNKLADIALEVVARLRVLERMLHHAASAAEANVDRCTHLVRYNALLEEIEERLNPLSGHAWFKTVQLPQRLSHAASDSDITTAADTCNTQIARLLPDQI